MDKLNTKELTRILQIDARAIGIPSGAANAFIDQTIKNIQKIFKNKRIITKKDLDRAIYAELKKYNSDFAYIYKNRGKII